MSRKRVNKYGIPVIVLLTGILFSCENDLDKIKLVTYDADAPSEVTQNLSIYYTDSGYAKVNIYAGISETYNKPQHVTKLKNGIKVEFYEDHGVVTSVLTAKYGEVNHVSGKMFVQDSVILKNLRDGRSLYTERLYWNQNDSTIYSDSPVTVQSKKGVGYGSSIRSKQDFSWYKLSDPRGDYENLSE